MDNTLVEYRQLGPEAALASILELAETVRRYRGSLVLLWHNSSFHFPPWKPYGEVYESCLSKLANMQRRGQGSCQNTGGLKGRNP